MSKKLYDHDFGTENHMLNCNNPEHKNKWEEDRERLREEALAIMEDANAWILVAVVNEDTIAQDDGDNQKMSKHYPCSVFMGHHKTSLAHMTNYHVQQAINALQRENDTLRRQLYNIFVAEEEDRDGTKKL